MGARLTIHDAGRTTHGTRHTIHHRLPLTDYRLPGFTNHMSVAAYGASNNLYLETNGYRRMTVLPSGNIGIGTTTPNNNLQIGSTTYSGNSLAMGNGTQNFAIDISANTIPTFFSDNNFSFMASGGGNGNVGIGTTTPAYKLDVAGDVNITGNFKVNGTNISNGSAFPRVSTITGMATSGTEYNLFGGTAVMPSNGDVCDINLGIDNSGSFPACKFTIMKVNGNAGFIVTGTQPAGVISTDTKVCGNYAGPFGYNFYVTVSVAGVVKIKCDDNRFTYTSTSIAYK